MDPVWCTRGQGLVDPIETCTKMILTEFPDIAGIWLFGSAASGQDTSGSDIDLALLHTKKLDRVRLWQCAQSVAARVGREIDLIDLLDASTVLRAQVMENGKRVYCADKFMCDRFETESLTDYLRFADERKGLLEDIRARGKVLGHDG